MNRIIISLIILISTATRVWPQSPTPLSSAPSASANMAHQSDETSITNMEALRARLKKANFTIPAPDVPTKNNGVILAGEKASDSEPDIKLVVIAYGTGAHISSIVCSWVAIASKASDGKAVGLSIGEWRYVACEVVQRNADEVDNWVQQCTTRWFAGGMVVEKRSIGGLTYDFTGSTSSATMTVEISRAK